MTLFMAAFFRVVANAVRPNGKIESEYSKREKKKKKKKTYCLDHKKRYLRSISSSISLPKCIIDE